MEFLKNFNVEELKLKRVVVYDKFLMAQTYKNAAVVLIDDILQNDNKLVEIGDVNIIADYENIGKGECALYHNVPNLVLPILLCTYQCIEQLLKGFVYIVDDKKYRHNTYELFVTFKDYYCFCNDIVQIFDKYVGDNLHYAIKRYMEENNMTSMTELYNSLRYSDLNNEGINYTSLKYIEIFTDNEISYDSSKNRAIKFVSEIKVDLNNLITHAVRIYKDVYDK